MHTFTRLFVLSLILLLAACSQSLPTEPLPSDFPNEENGLISPEGQAIIDALENGTLEAPKLNIAPIELDDGLSVQGTVPEAVQRPFFSSLEQFLDYRADLNPSEADWSTNLCTNSPDRSIFFDFRESCTRHDYGYRNWKKFDAFTENNRKVIDEQFLRDMKDHCGTRSIFAKPGCYKTAYLYYGVIRGFGS